MSSIRWRVVIILALIAASVFALVPRNVTQRSHDPATGRMRDTTVRRVPIDMGLDLQGGVHLALEIDESWRRMLSAMYRRYGTPDTRVTMRPRIANPWT